MAPSGAGGLELELDAAPKLVPEMIVNYWNHCDRGIQNTEQPIETQQCHIVRNLTSRFTPAPQITLVGMGQAWKTQNQPIGELWTSLIENKGKHNNMFYNHAEMKRCDPGSGILAWRRRRDNIYARPHGISSDLESSFGVLLYQVAKCRSPRSVDLSKASQVVVVFDDSDLDVGSDNLVRGGVGKHRSTIKRNNPRVQDALKKLRSSEWVLSIFDRHIDSTWEVDDDGNLCKDELQIDSSASRNRWKRKGRLSPSSKEHKQSYYGKHDLNAEWIPLVLGEARGVKA
ncbi:hypothetical protein B0F90DRAFT_1670072 [Multifurca ochricompacta]|uniref:Uncharacterized protein n=1 Tax=Multifurca ochricompacta TaxID=376703 RepID=A0AAD4QL12_9AGAM|nr:hypothetical protein B0F90DRAFT_1670072 [Multifurca ochricompacta]